jgi:hypothetical protein
MNWEGYISEFRVMCRGHPARDSRARRPRHVSSGNPANLDCFRPHTRAYPGQAVPANRGRHFDGLSSSLGNLHLRRRDYPLRLGGMV